MRRVAVEMEEAKSCSGKYWRQVIVENANISPHSLTGTTPPCTEKIGFYLILLI